MQVPAQLTSQRPGAGHSPLAAPLPQGDSGKETDGAGHLPDTTTQDCVEGSTAVAANPPSPPVTGEAVSQIVTAPASLAPAAHPAAARLMETGHIINPDKDWRRRVFVAQMDVQPGNPRANADKFISLMREAHAGGARLVVGSELCIASYFIGDDWEQEAYLQDVEYHQQRVVLESARLGIAVVAGFLVVDRTKKNEDGRPRKYNAGVVIQNGLITQEIYKTNMPKYHIFDDERHFTPAWKYLRENGLNAHDYYQPITIDLGDGVMRRFGVSLCEDMWSDDYPDNPVLTLAQNGAETILNLSCSPWKTRKNDKRHRVVASRLAEIRAQGKKVDFVYANNVGLQDNGKNILIFDGASTLYDSDGKKIWAMEAFLEGARALYSEDAAQIDNSPPSKEKDLIELRDALIYGLRKLMDKIAPGKRAIILLSGGRDSLLMAYLMVKALGRERVIGVNLPSKHNRSVTKNIAADFARNIGMPYGVIPIQKIVNQRIRQLKEFVAVDPVTGEEIRADFSDPDWTELGFQNLQARERGAGWAMLLTHFLRGITTDNGNKDEAAAGYATMYGDMVGAMAPFGDIHKDAHINAMIARINDWEGREIVPPELFSTPPSAELGKGQDVTKKQGDPFYYDYHGPLNNAFIAGQKRPVELLRAYILGDIDRLLGVEAGLTKKYFPTHELFVTDVERMWRLFSLSTFKGIQRSPIFTTSRRSRGFDRREAQLKGIYFETAYTLLKDIVTLVGDDASARELIKNAQSTADYESILQHLKAGLGDSLMSLPPEYPVRAFIAPEARAWKVESPAYVPPYYVSPSVIANDRTVKNDGWADPEDYRQIDFSRRLSFEGPYSFDAEGRPLNPTGRTGLAGRGLLGKWGPNQAADPIVTRNNPETGELEILVIERGDGGGLALPGGMVDAGESPLAAMARELEEETSVSIDFSNATVSYQGFVQDRRNTDHAWMESTAGHVHLTAEQAQSVKPNIRVNADGTREVLQIVWMPVTQENLRRLHSTHADMVRIALLAVPHALDVAAKEAPAPAKRIAIFGGSFNPPHTGHASAIKYILASGMFDEVWCIPTAKHAFDKKMPNLAQRSNLVARMITDINDPRIRISLIEGDNTDTPSYTIDTLLRLKDIYPHHQFSIAIGTDIEDELDKWHRIDDLRREATFFRIPRAGYVDSDLPEISSSELRIMLANNDPRAKDYFSPSVLEALGSCLEPF